MFPILISPAVTPGVCATAGAATIRPIARGSATSIPFTVMSSSLRLLRPEGPQPLGHPKVRKDAAFGIVFRFTPWTEPEAGAPVPRRYSAAAAGAARYAALRQRCRRA